MYGAKCAEIDRWMERYRYLSIGHIDPKAHTDVEAMCLSSMRKETAGNGARRRLVPRINGRSALVNVFGPGSMFASSNRCLTSNNKKLVVTSATLVVTGALQVVTKSY